MASRRRNWRRAARLNFPVDMRGEIGYSATPTEKAPLLRQGQENHSHV